ncbi:hypothetical protein NZK35_19200 [Stieleria sp. ICT_E10.1]|uniref:hypothetical protein n=1 Tax=Stieleria sedimenti TaxID=2976331 RepID=UPI00217F5994|nr:hypothetical protein [Stieleria sedimenti]MCS7468784.1 hypothetical protein [Stieleria sedimenti]
MHKDSSAIMFLLRCSMLSVVACSTTWLGVSFAQERQTDNAEQIGLYIDSFCRGGTPLPVPGAMATDGETVRLSYTSAVPLKSAQLHDTTDTGLRSKRDWQSLSAEIASDEVTAPRPPASANTWFIALTDQRDAMVTTPVQFANQ